MVIRRLAIALLMLSVGVVGCGEDAGGGNASNSGLDASTGETDPDAGGEEDDGGESDEPDADASDDGGDTDHDADTDTDSGDTDPDPDPDPDPEECDFDNVQDTDGDGLYNCEEAQICSDPENSDTDDDGLTDAQEVYEQTDPCDPDSDGDGLEDGEELEYDLDPTKESTYDDGVPDSARWIVQACDDPQSEPLNFSYNTDANWSLALASGFDNNRIDLDIDSADVSNRLGASLYDDPSVEVSGFIFSHVPEGDPSPAETLANYESVLEAHTSEVDFDTFNPRAFDTHDLQKARTHTYVVETPSETTVNELREELLFDIAPLERADHANELPSTDGSDYDRHVVKLTVIRREYDDGQVQTLTLGAIAPESKYQSNDEVEFRADDLTNTTNVAAAAAGDRARCDVFVPEEASKADFFWVLDQSTSMDEHYEAVQKVAEDFFDKLENSAIDYRNGVTTMDPNHNGRLLGTDDNGITDRPTTWDDEITTPGWTTTRADFEEHFWWMENCAQVGGLFSSDCHGSNEYGLETAQEGIEYMLGLDGSSPPSHEAIRHDAELITIWMADEEANSIGGGVTPDDYARFFADHTTAFAIVDDPESEDSGCGLSQSTAYPYVADYTGGTAASICKRDENDEPDHEDTITQILEEAIHQTAQSLPHTPISSSLRVSVAETWVPRSHDNGFRYYSDGNRVAFFGEFRPEIPDDPNGKVDHISITYETFQQASKEFVDQTGEE